MKIFFWACLFLALQNHSYSQIQAGAKYLKLSGGRVIFGTGDIGGFGVYVEGSGNPFKKIRYLAEHLQVGAELYFENGVKNPKVENPTGDEFSRRDFSHISLTGLNIKSTFYPFRKAIKGLNVSLGAGAAYYYFSYEGAAVREVYSPTVSRRMSELRFENKFVLGYRISAGYDVFMLKGVFLAGIRLDFVNFNNGDFNSLAAAKIGYRF